MKSPSQAVGEQTRVEILDAAEELFGQYGPQGVSLRSVNAAAGVGSASIHYHFGSKEALVAAVLARRNKTVLRRYDELLTALAARPSPTPRDLVELFALPFIELLEAEPVRGFHWIKFAGHLSQLQDPELLKVTSGPGSINDRFSEAVLRVLSDVPPETALIRWQIAATAVLQLLGNADMPGLTSGGGRPTAQSDGAGSKGLSQEFVETLLDVAATGLAGPRAGGAARRSRGGRTPGARRSTVSKRGVKDDSSPKPSRQRR